VGGGPVGLSAAIALKEKGVSVAVAAPKPQFDVGRTAAVMQPALDFLTPLLPESALEDIGAPLLGIRIIDSTRALLRAPTVTFRSTEIGQDRFGLNLTNDGLVRALEMEIKNRGILRLEAPFSTFEDIGGRLDIRLGDETKVRASCLIGADGRKSPVRQAAGIGCRSWTYDQIALTFHIQHSVDHLDLSTELHTREGPLTFVPLSEGRSSVVWMMKAAKATEMAQQDRVAFARALTRESHGLMGKVTIETERAVIPMSGLTADLFAKERVALIGEAAHAFPPIGAQGLNLGLRDVRDLVACIASKMPDWSAAMTAYHRLRQTDVRLRTFAVDSLNRSLLLGQMPADMLRGAGIALLAGLPFLRKAAMRLGLGEESLLPTPTWKRGSAAR
jgi:2-octaprenyl-6-methoxyphenol hydroxylase